MSLNATATHPQADSFITLADADTYVLENIFDQTAWDALSDAQKEIALRMATKVINNFSFTSAPITDTQSLKLPGMDATTFYASGSFGETTTSSTSLQKSDLYPDDFWNKGVITNTTQASDAYMQIKTISDFVSSTGTLTHTAFSPTGATADSWKLIEGVPDEVMWATVEVAIWIAAGNYNQASTGNVKREKIGDYEVEYNGGYNYSFYQIPDSAKGYLEGFISTTAEFIT